MNNPLIKIVEYSEKSIAVIGETIKIKEKFKVNGQYIARFNKYLSIKDQQTNEISKQAGWIFHIKHRELVETIVKEFLAENQPTIEDVFNSSSEESINTEEEQQPLF